MEMLTYMRSLAGHILDGCIQIHCIILTNAYKDVTGITE